MLKLIALAVAVTVAGPGYSGTVDDRQLERLAAREGERQALSTLIRRHWIVGEARERGIVVTDAEVDEAIESGAERSRAAARTDLLWTAIKAQVAEPAAKSVTPDQVKAYVDANPQVIPETRTVRLIATKNRRAAKAILKRLRRGATWASLGGVKETFDRTDATAAARAVFRAPLKRTTRYGRVVFRVIKHAPPRPAPRAEQEARAWELLASVAQERALDAFASQFTAKWRQRTACAPSYGYHEDCGSPPSGQPQP